MVYTMFKDLAAVFIAVFLIAPVACAQEVNKQAPPESPSGQGQASDQQISEFSLGGYGEKGKKSWDISGKSADIFDDVVKLNDVVANMYGDEEIKLTADKGDFDKTEGKVHVEQNVVITTSAGSKLTTDSLDWDRKKQVVATKDQVHITRDNMTTIARGAVGEPNLSHVTLEKDVQVHINPKEEAKTGAPQNKIVITCDGPLEIDYAKNIATFKNNVKVDTQDNIMYSDSMDVYFLAGDKNSVPKEDGASAAGMGMMGTKIDKIFARGNVKIIRGENTSYSEEAVYTAVDRKIVLLGRPKLILYSTEGLGASLGN